MRVLWVENNAQFVSVALPMFLHAHSVLVVPSLAAARQCLTNEAFDAIILDFDLDDGKGLELVPLILSLSNHPLLVAASSHAVGNTQLLHSGASVACNKMDFSQINTILLKHHS